MRKPSFQIWIWSPGVELSVEALWPDERSQAEMNRWSHTEVWEVFLMRGKMENCRKRRKRFCFNFLKNVRFKVIWFVTSLLLYCLSMALL